MKEVSCKALDLWFRELPKKGIAPERLAEGTEYTVTQLRNKHERIEWSAFVRIMQNVGQIWTGDELEVIGRSYFDSPHMRPFSVVARLMFSATDFYRWVFVKTMGVGNQGFSCVEASLQEVAPRHLVLELTLPPGFEPCPEFFRVSKGTFTGMPRVLGLPFATVEMTPIERGARYTVVVPPGGGLLGRLKRALLWPFTVRAAAQELKEAHESLQARYGELEQARAELASKAEQLQTVNLLGRELTRYTELRLLADAVVKLLTERFRATGVAIWLARGGTSEQMVGGSVPGTGVPPRVLALSTGGAALGRIELWGVGPADARMDLLEDLVPWLSIALENARSFELLRDYQSDLEKRVAERTDQLQESLRRLTEADRQKTEFFANASHELRTPLTLMLSPIEGLVASSTLPDEVREELRGALRNGYRLLKLINDVLDLSKLEAGKMRLAMGQTDLSRLLEEVIRPWRPALTRRRITLETHLPPSLLLVADAERLEQVALNLLSNAVKFTPDGGTIRVGAALAEERVQVYVENTGEGIDPDDLPRLFDRFAQSMHSRSRRFGTTGLGLPVVRELVELHGGTVTVDNLPGERVRFVVSLPAGAGTAPEQAIDVPRPAAIEVLQYQAIGERETAPSGAEAGQEGLPLLLIAEDNADLRTFLVRVLREQFRVIEAADGEEALRLATERDPDLILSDVMMPGIDGVELCRRLKENPATLSVPFVMLTARSDLDQKVTAIKEGADDYLVKPFHVKEVIARLRAQLRLRILANQVAHREKLAALGTLVAGVAHEVRNPLNGVINSLLPLRQMLGDSSSEARELIDLAVEGARRVERISSELLAQTHSGGGGKALTDLCGNVRLALELLTCKAERGPALEHSMPGEPVTILAEPGALSQVWINLIDNAIDAAGPSGTVGVSVSRDEGWALVEVADDGPGIDARHLNRIFDPFFTTKAVGSGTGLGLSIVRQIVERHGGNISVDSRPGHGARFRVALPAVNERRGVLHGQG